MRKLGAISAILLLASGCTDTSEVSVTEVEWTILVNDPQYAAGVHSIFTIAEASPSSGVTPGDLYGFLEWEGETVVDLCNVQIREVGSEYVQIGDGYQTNEGCGDNPNAMQDAFDLLGLPDVACVGVMIDDTPYEYCAPLNEL